MLFTDGSVNIQTGIGFGASLVLSDIETSLEVSLKQVKVKRFEDTSSTRLELQTFLWALDEIQTKEKITVYSDSQNILGLIERREKLEQNNYFSKGNKRLKNWELYQEFFQKTDKMQCEFIKVKGHKKSYEKNKIDRFFSLVDRASRNALREFMQQFDM